MKLAILDPGYSHIAGHHHMVNLGISTSFARKGVETVVFASRYLNPLDLGKIDQQNFTVIPFFQTPCYVDKNLQATHSDYLALSNSFSAELASLFESPQMDGVTSVYLHTSYSFHLLALGELLKKTPLKHSGNLIVSLMYSPSARIHNESLEIWDTGEYFRYKAAFDILNDAATQNKLNIQFATSCRTFQKIYQKFWALGPIEIHPAINQHPTFVELQKFEKSKTRVLLYWGVPKIDKGIEFSAELCQIASRKFPQVEFLFQYSPYLPNAQDQFCTLMNNLREASQNSRNILLREGYIDPDNYQSLLNSCEIIAILYSPSEYKFKTSGIFWDALNLCKDKWLVSKNTWIADELSELKIPHQLVDYGNISSALAGLENLLTENPLPLIQKLQNMNSKSEYLRALTSSFSDWLFTKVAPGIEKENKKRAGDFQVTRSLNQQT